MADLVRDSTHATQVEVWVRVGDQLQLAASTPAGTALRLSLPDSAALEERAGQAGTVVPVFLDAEPLGALLIRRPRGEPFSPTERRLLNDLASQAGLVFSRFRLVEELRESRTRIVAAQDEERRRIERDLHDGAQQRLVSLGMAIRLAQRHLGKDVERGTDGGVDVNGLLDQAVAELGTAVAELRAIARGLRPLDLDSGLAPAIRSLTTALPIPVTLDVDAVEVPVDVATTAYYVASEALANVVKHASAESVSVSVARQDGLVHLRISDDGCGGAHARPGSGLAGLVDRVSAAGGRLSVGAAAGRGTTVEAVLPCAR
jgi:signal transduction histidine kinase